MSKMRRSPSKMRGPSPLKRLPIATMTNHKFKTITSQARRSSK